MRIQSVWERKWEFLRGDIGTQSLITLYVKNTRCINKSQSNKGVPEVPLIGYPHHTPAPPSESPLRAISWPPFNGPWISTPIDCRSEGLLMANNCRQTRMKKQTISNRRQVIRIDVLPDDVLLDIFDFYTNGYLMFCEKIYVEGWQSLVHVCRRWRILVLGSPRRLNLRLYCTPKTPAKDTLDVWPALPLLITDDGDLPLRTDNIIAALGQSNRVCHVYLLYLTGREFEDVLAPMQVPFPELTVMLLRSDDKTLPIIRDSFLDGSAPRLEYVELSGVPFPGLPKLLLSANHLLELKLTNIPHSGYISPEAIVALIPVLSSLRILFLEFQSPRSRPDLERRSLPPPKRSILPALERFQFKGVTEYLEDLVTFIVAPQIETSYITFFNQIDFDTPRLAQFINRTPTLGARNNAHVQFGGWKISVALLDRFRALKIEILCSEPDWQLSSVAQICSSSFPPSLTVENLYIERQYWIQTDAIESTLWLELLLPFTAVKNLYLSQEITPGVAVALQELVGGRITEVLPGLQNIFVQWLQPSGPVQEIIGQFVAARRHSDHPITISNWDKGSVMESI